jgi:hypothetical protein
MDAFTPFDATGERPLRTRSGFCATQVQGIVVDHQRVPSSSWSGARQLRIGVPRLMGGPSGWRHSPALQIADIELDLRNRMHRLTSTGTFKDVVPIASDHYRQRLWAGFSRLATVATQLLRMTLPVSANSSSRSRMSLGASCRPRIARISSKLPPPSEDRHLCAKQHARASARSL